MVTEGVAVGVVGNFNSLRLVLRKRDNTNTRNILKVWDTGAHATYCLNHKLPTTALALIPLCPHAVNGGHS